jgi:hypothetical protein
MKATIDIINKHKLHLSHLLDSISFSYTFELNLIIIYHRQDDILEI